MADAERITWKSLLEENEQEAPGVKNLSRAAIDALVYDDLERELPFTVPTDLRKGMKGQMTTIMEELNREGYIDGGILAVRGEGPLRFAVTVARPGEVSEEAAGWRKRKMVKTTIPLEPALEKAEEVGGEVVPEVNWGGEPRRFLTREQIKNHVWFRRKG